ncbi:MAG: hypothetical protein ABR881_27040 [Candidatus Sulfotelmatobacter sp.]|jgi:hypothetical protein
MAARDQVMGVTEPLDRLEVPPGAWRVLGDRFARILLLGSMLKTTKSQRIYPPS